MSSKEDLRTHFIETFGPKLVSAGLDNVHAAEELDIYANTAEFMAEMPGNNLRNAYIEIATTLIQVITTINQGPDTIINR